MNEDVKENTLNKFKTALQIMNTNLLKSIHDGTFISSMQDANLSVDFTSKNNFKKKSRYCKKKHEETEDEDNKEEIILNDKPNKFKCVGLVKPTRSKFTPPLFNAHLNSENSMKVLPHHIEEKCKSPDNYLIEMIENEIIDNNYNITWDDIAGLQFVKSIIKEVIVWPLLRPDLFTGLRKPAKGILLFGPPGTGKTMIAKCIASFCNDMIVKEPSCYPTIGGSIYKNALPGLGDSALEMEHTKRRRNMTFFNISSSVLLSKWVGESEKLVRVLFETARKHAPSLIFIDEVDALLCSRNGSSSLSPSAGCSSAATSENESINRLKTEFLIRLDGLNNYEECQHGHPGDKTVIFIGATNRPNKLDEAVRRRFVKRLYIPLPDAAARVTLVTNLMKGQCNTLNPNQIQEICGKLTEGYSGADMIELCREAALGPVRCLSSENIYEISIDQVGPITSEHFQQGLLKVKPTVTESDITVFTEWNRIFGCQ